MNYADYMAQDQADCQIAMAVAPYKDDAIVEAATRDVLDGGASILQIHLLAETERGHVNKLLDMFNPPAGAKILDAGCGVGAVSKMMKETNSSLTFVLQNISKSQLDMCPPFEKIQSDFHSIPVADEAFDAVMFNYSIGHAELEKAMSEAARVIKAGGILFIYDLSGSNRLSVSALGYKIHKKEMLEKCAEKHGFRLDDAWLLSETYTSHFDKMMDGMDREKISAIFKDVVPTAWRFLRN